MHPSQEEVVVPLHPSTFDSNSPMQDAHLLLLSSSSLSLSLKERCGLTKEVQKEAGTVLVSHSHEMDRLNQDDTTIPRIVESDDESLTSDCEEDEVTTRTRLAVEEEASSGNKSGFDDEKKGGKKKRVSFARVEIREHILVIGDHPTCARGLPISLGWEHAANIIVKSIEEHETYRDTTNRRRRRYEMRLSAAERRRRLRKISGYAPVELNQLEHEMNEERRAKEEALAAELLELFNNNNNNIE